MYEDQVITALLVSVITLLIYRIYTWLAKLEKRLERIEVNQEWLMKRIAAMEKYLFRDYYDGHDPPSDSDSDS
jgi:type II secretory pathway component PulJ